MQFIARVLAVVTLSAITATITHIGVTTLLEVNKCTSTIKHNQSCKVVITAVVVEKEEEIDER